MQVGISYIFSPLAIIDLIAIAPYLLSAAGGWFVVLRFARLLRLLRLASLGRFSAAWGLVSSAINERRMELLMSLGVGVLALLVSSTLLYWIEGSEQPEDFGSIPRAMWWAVATLTTVGYGDAMPITAAGKVIAGFVAVIGIGLIAMPTGILAAAFSDAMKRHKQQSGSDDR
jgi:voltage-gated potassium channel